jgi:NAD(P)H-flavin reductase/truncated hemoglobin YjbI
MSFDTGQIQETFALLEPRLAELTAYFYGRLFAAHPDFRALFPPAMDLQRARLSRVLAELVRGLDDPDALRRRLRDLGRDHRKFGIGDEHYARAGEALLASVALFLGPRWTPEARRDWAGFYAFLTEAMLEAARAERTPAWWVGEVSGHERRTPDVAVLTVRPDQPLPYAAGQYVTVQTSRWPRVWRPYSIANAPREDGLLDFHVSAVPGGWISGTLARRTEAGHALLLGPALGSMTLDPGSDRDLLCVAGGTGLAPLKAITQQALAEGRRVLLVFGARTRDRLYDLPDLRRLEAAHRPLLEVVAAVSDEPFPRGLRGTAVEALDGPRDWSGHDAYVAGPPAMISAAVARLRRLGVPAERVRHDPVPEAPCRADAPVPPDPPGAGTGRLPTVKNMEETEAERLMDLAMRLFAELGYDGTSTRLIADAAGIPVDRVVGLVGDKPTLYQAVMRRTMEEEKEAIEAALSAFTPTREGVIALIDSLLDFYVGHQQFLTLWLHRWVGTPPTCPGPRCTSAGCPSGWPTGSGTWWSPTSTPTT